MKYDLIIIGGGPAGITAGIYASRLNLKSLIITKNLGGQIYNKAVAIENWPGIKSAEAVKLAKQMEDHLRSLNAEILQGEVIGIEKKEDFSVFTKNKEFQAISVVVAAGSAPKSLNIPGEKEFLGKGVSACSVCDGPLFKGKDVAVIGGGNAGFETAVFLTNIARKIYILEFSEEPKSFGELQDIARSSKKVEVITGAELKEIKGGKFVESIIFNQNGVKKELLVQGVFIETGYIPASKFLLGTADLNGNGEVIVDSNCMTSQEGLFAAGDICASSFKQIIIAAGDGAKAVLSAYHYIKKKNIRV
ncbi:MAG: hypothetical protein A2365_03545 [Candidatus Nealsonbacteria bacterium RIFOXYB1_FULL_40_15]|uniref:FAD/NAD(P)-binding domain-containing protein n=2 Tax=Candidatus Nealsoniibacteriota TaxID=1817911 RepID=A0A1G2ESX6_9BACT|nr:MAG: hypothetical protein A2365_03545 [Candidatus Nealsonbacteria bacterium RIFOXYB1_FULL_40_15]OGZ28378.1 MAG: hypothetical protein A2427_01225 [Candidatus Nealsonbacteria bacterium RIFOXYC1_FULL_40_7]OGZ29503.1 MAG: hypothetical protein A2562_02320 [Candidatus Nealsonbacteria bacterium RIFOXYD1_FULL_39_11]